MTTRDHVAIELAAFYGKERIAASNFDCEHSEQCRQAMNDVRLYRGRAAFVGSKYGNKRKVLIIAMDAGNTEPEGMENVIQEMDARRRAIEDTVPSNPHMRGTVEFLRVVLGSADEADNSLAYCSIVNAAKCSRVCCSRPVSNDLYQRCAQFLDEEIDIIAPDFIWIQGRATYSMLLRENIRFRQSDEGCVSEGIRFLRYGDIPTVKTAHPSARGKSRPNFRSSAHARAAQYGV